MTSSSFTVGVVKLRSLKCWVTSDTSGDSMVEHGEFSLPELENEDDEHSLGASTDADSCGSLDPFDVDPFDTEGSLPGEERQLQSSGCCGAGGGCRRSVCIVAQDHS